MAPETKPNMGAGRVQADLGFLSGRVGRALPSLEHSPGDGGRLPQEALDLLSAPLLMLRVCSQSIEDPGDAGCCGVMAPKHDRVHFCTEVLIRQAASILHLKKAR